MDQRDVVALALLLVERIVAIGIAGLSIFCGYRLFQGVQYESTGEGKISLPGGASVFVSRVGPGVFFALFGAIVLSMSFYKGVELQTSDGTHLNGILQTGTPATSAAPAVARESLAQYFDVLDRVIPSALRRDLDERSRNDINLARKNIKLALMQAAWDTTEWGSYAVFESWIESADSAKAPPRAIAKAVVLYRGH